MLHRMPDSGSRSAFDKTLNFRVLKRLYRHFANGAGRIKPVGSSRPSCSRHWCTKGYREASREVCETIWPFSKQQKVCQRTECRMRRWYSEFWNCLSPSNFRTYSLMSHSFDSISIIQVLSKADKLGDYFLFLYRARWYLRFIQNSITASTTNISRIIIA